MRVLLAHNRYRTEGGEERHVDLLEDWLRRAGIEVGRLDVTSPQSASLSTRVRLGLTLAYRSKGAAATREAMTRFRPDVVHFHNFLPLLTSAAFREAQRYGAAVVLTLHNYRFACPAGTLLRNGEIHEDCIEGSSLLCGIRNSRGSLSESIAYGIGIEAQRRLRLLHRWVDAYVAPSRFLASMLNRAGYPPDRIHTIYHGTPIDTARSNGGDFILYTGRLSEEKGVRTLLSALQRIPDARFVLAGDGPLATEVREQERPGLEYRGYVNTASLAELRRKARFTVVPSECFEVQPFAVLESMAAGKAVVASRLGGLEEIIEDGRNGVFVPPGDPQALADTIGALWTDPTRAAAMGDQALSYAEEHFSLPDQTGRVVELYEELLAERG